jgi:Family of unknown function (DUF6152)
MRTKRLACGAILSGLLAAANPALAHHAWRGFDKSNPTTLKGIVTEFDWGNPHVWITLEVKDDKGNVEKWSAGGPSPSRLANVGWDKDTVKLGEEITVTGARGSGNSHEMRLDKVTLPDGREMPCYSSR